jgi:hypothetical protein
MCGIFGCMSGENYFHFADVEKCEDGQLHNWAYQRIKGKDSMVCSKCNTTRHVVFRG